MTLISAEYRVSLRQLRLGSYAWCALLPPKDVRRTVALRKDQAPEQRAHTQT